MEEYHKLEFLKYFYREGGKNTGTILLVSLQPVVKMRKKGWTKFFAGASVIHGDNVPAISKADELPLREELSSSWEPERAAFANLVCYIFDGFITCQLVMCNSLPYLSSVH